jgi:hypothetical protein
MGMPYSRLGCVNILMLSLWEPIHFGYWSPTIQVFYQIKLTHKKINHVGIFLQEYDFDSIHTTSRV